MNRATTLLRLATAACIALLAASGAPAARAADTVNVANVSRTVVEALYPEVSRQAARRLRRLLGLAE